MALYFFLHSPLKSKAVQDGSVQSDQTRQLSGVFCIKRGLTPGSSAVPACLVALSKGVCVACKPGLVARDSKGLCCSGFTKDYIIATQGVSVKPYCMAKGPCKSLYTYSSLRLLHIVRRGQAIL